MAAQVACSAPGSKAAVRPELGSASLWGQPSSSLELLRVRAAGRLAAVAASVQKRDTEAESDGDAGRAGDVPSLRRGAMLTAVAVRPAASSKAAADVCGYARSAAGPLLRLTLA